ncbi:MAG: hypothetical protein O3A10_02695 [Chloroflexi bacterium]|nr:hypothetical protein [Chloroflexota bacterium]MDA1145186.1 hypothetical protein [Chloroflexota bacterium]
MDRQINDHPQPRRDALAGGTPALYLALGIGVITGGSVVLVMVLIALSIGAIGGLGTGVSSLFAMVGVSVAFWLGKSIGVIAGLSAGFRAWVALYPAYERRRETAERRAAVSEAELLLRRPPDPHAPLERR